MALLREKYAAAKAVRKSRDLPFTPEQIAAWEKEKRDAYNKVMIRERLPMINREKAQQTELQRIREAQGRDIQPVRVVTPRYTGPTVGTGRDIVPAVPPRVYRDIVPAAPTRVYKDKNFKKGGLIY